VPAADAIAKRDAVYLDIGPAGTYAIDVTNVDSPDDFVRLMAYLQRVAIVKRVTVLEAADARLRLQLDLSIGLRGFRTLVETDDTLQSQSDADPVPLAPGAIAVPLVPRYRLK
jgi:uncharacterized protein